MKVENSLVKIEETPNGMILITFKEGTDRIRAVRQVELHALTSAIEEWKASDPIWNASSAKAQLAYMAAPKPDALRQNVVQQVVTLTDDELGVLIGWNAEAQHACARDQDYVSAIDHKRRREELEKMKGAIRSGIGAPTAAPLTKPHQS